jgi:hypothetical protein
VRGEAHSSRIGAACEGRGPFRQWFRFRPRCTASWAASLVASSLTLTTHTCTQACIHKAFSRTGFVLGRRSTHAVLHFISLRRGAEACNVHACRFRPTTRGSAGLPVTTLRFQPTLSCLNPLSPWDTSARSLLTPHRCHTDGVAGRRAAIEVLRRSTATTPLNTHTHTHTHTHNVPPPHTQHTAHTHTP